jgi:hypothetical protein
VGNIRESDLSFFLWPERSHFTAHWRHEKLSPAWILQKKTGRETIRRDEERT